MLDQVNILDSHPKKYLPFNLIKNPSGPQQTRFLPGAPAVNFNDPNTQIAGLAG